MKNFKTSKMMWGFALMLLTLFVIAGCGDAKNETATGQTEQSDTQTQAQDQAVQADAAEEEKAEPDDQAADAVRVIEHAMGTTTIEGTPQRIVTLYQGANDTTVALGIKPVGIVESWSQKPVYEYLRDALDGIPQLGEEHQPNLEELHKLQPDLIIGTMTRHEAIYEQLSQIAPTVMIDQVYEWKSTVQLMGEALDRKADTDQMMVDWDNRLADFKEKMGDRLPMEVTITNFRADHARIFFMGFGGIVLKDAGFDRPQAHSGDTWGVQLTSKESIPDMNADVIFNFNTGDSDAVASFYKEWTGHPLWSSLDAVKNNQVFEVDEVAWNTGGGYLAANLMLDQLYMHFGLEQ